MSPGSVLNRILQLSRGNAFREAASIIVIVALATTMLWRVFIGDWPVGDDNAVHLVRISQLEQSLLHHGFPWTWSNRWFAGAPIALVYPIGADFFVLLVHAVSFWFLRLEQAYGLTFWMFYCGYGYAIYYFTRYVFASRAAGVLASIFLLTDAGSYDTGGWFWIAQAGVWTGALAMVPSLIGTVQVAKLFDNPSATTTARIALCAGLGTLCHPIALLYFAIAVPLLWVCRLTKGEWADWQRAAAWLCLAAVCAFLIAAPELLPRMAAKGYVAQLGTAGSSLPEVGRSILSGDLFPRTWFISVGLGFAGCIVLLLRPASWLHLFTSLFALGAITLSSSSVTRIFGHELANWAEQRVIFPRLLMLAKYFWFSAGAGLVILAIRSCKGTLATWNIWKVLLTALAAPLLFFVARTFVNEQVLQENHWHSMRSDLEDRKLVVQWLNGLPQEPGEFYRVAHGFGTDMHKLTDLGIELKAPMYKVSDTPTGDHFAYDIDADSREAFRLLSIRFAITKNDLERDDLVLERRFGEHLRLYRFVDWNPKPFLVQGTGEVVLERFDDEEILLRAYPGASGRLRVNVTYYPSWAATRDGVPVTITPTPIADVEKCRFMEVPLAPGLYRFHYQRNYLEYVSLLLFVCAIILTAMLPRLDIFRRTATVHP